MGAANTAEERGALRDELARFARRAIEPRVARPEQALSPSEVTAILAEADGLGLAGSIDEPTGLGAWEGLPDDGVPGPSLATLVELGRASASVAFALHQRALARAACRLAGLGAPDVAALAIAPGGHHGLGRQAVARWLGGASLDDADHALLADGYRAGGPRIATVEPGGAGVVVPVWVGAVVQWQLVARDQLDLRLEAHAHGLDELATATITARAVPAAPTLGEAAARAVFAALAGAHQLATVAIARGAVERGLRLARRYAATRSQGAAIIDRHAAVLQLLGQARSELVVVDALLDRAAGRPLDADGFVAALAIRARAMPALADAANAALQVFGGLGYMRDVGAEKVVRDVNHLRAIGGPLGELALIVAEWERLHG